MMAMQRTHSLRGELLVDEPMARHTSWRVGGPARRYYRPADIDDLALFLQQLPEEEPLHWVGLGSNLLVRDGGIDGTVIATSGLLNEIERCGEESVRVECGVSCAKVARFCAREGLAGAEFLCGIPGTMGGALAMNAGCFGGETWQLVERVETLDHQGKLHQRKPGEYRIGYRHVRGPVGEWFVAAHLQLQRGNTEALQASIRALLEQRGNSQPTQLPNAGSVFRNPQNDYAARLIETAGLKGHCIGGACVSQKHANFIVNTGEATAMDIEALIQLVQSEVEKQHGIRLQREVHIIGELPEDAG
jgi:UDP-N-acetylmuramate dehydrogenase